MKPSHRPEGMPSSRHAKCGREVSRSDRSGQPNTGQLGRRAATGPNRPPTQGATTKSATASTPYATHSRQTAWLEESPPMTAPPKLQNAQKYCEFHEQNGHTTIECRELKKALYVLADKGEIDRFLKRGSRFLRREQEPAPPPPRDEECSTEVVATIAGGYAEGITRMINRSEHPFINKKSTTLYNPKKKNQKTKQTQTKRRGERRRQEGAGGYTLGSPPSSCSSFSEAPASASRGVVASFPASLPLAEGGINSTSLGSWPAGAHPHSGGKLRSSYLPETRWPGSSGPCPVLSASQASRSACSFSQCRWYRATSPSSLRHSATALTPWWKTSAMAISSSVILGGSEVVGVTRSQDLTMSWTRESLAAGFALMKLAEGRRAIGEEPPITWDATPAVLEGARCSCMSGVRSPDDRLPDRSAPASPTCEGAEATTLPGWSSVHCHFRTDRLMAGFFPQGTREGAISPPLADAWRRPPPVRGWRPRSRRASALPSLDWAQPVRAPIRTYSRSPRSQDEGENGDRSLGPHGRPLYTWRAAYSQLHPPRESQWHTRAPGNSDPSSMVSITAGVRPFRLSTDLPGPNGASEEELVDALSEDELLNDRSEKEPGEPIPEEALELVEDTSASGLDWDAAKQGLPCVPSASNSLGDLMRGVDLGHCIGSLFGFPILILLGDAGHHPAINKGREVGELRVPTLHLGAG
ncbi:hypothetical protein Cgig2_015409 [Carnegiea gigantea]|uniref:Retrotransposon gag domain-containing protein n=1 Tax=Carnegiea gigantea TaxID=171969 RepID=A0A9Q1QBG7_9CARY|nr:hypothetical protein Cgig2_015409 [Carnegiea gigantea]